MAKEVLLDVELVGPRAGQTVTLGKTRFIDGRAQVSSKAEGQLNILALYHNAHVIDSKEHAEAVEAWERNPGNPNFRKATTGETGGGTDQPPGDTSAPGETSASEPSSKRGKR